MKQVLAVGGHEFDQGGRCACGHAVGDDPVRCPLPGADLSSAEVDPAVAADGFVEANRAAGAADLEKTNWDLINEFFRDLPVEFNRDIFRSTMEVRWPLPPRAILEGRIPHLRRASSVVAWRTETLETLMAWAGLEVLKETVYACRVQEQVTVLEAEMREVSHRFRESGRAS